MIEVLGEAGGKVVILDYKDAESCLLRVQGFKEVLEKFNRGRTAGRIEIVAELPGDGKKDKGDRAAEDAYCPSGFGGDFCDQRSFCAGEHWRLCSGPSKADQVKIVAFDGQKEGKEAIRDGKIYADPIQHPDKIGEETAKSILKYFAGERVAGGAAYSDCPVSQSRCSE